MLTRLAAAKRSVKLDLKENGTILDRTLEMLARLDWEDSRLWFHGRVDALGETGFRKLRRARPQAVLQCAIDDLLGEVIARPGAALKRLREFQRWGVRRFAVRWNSPRLRKILDRLDRAGFEVDLYGPPDLNAFLKTVLLNPTAVTADFNFPQWHFFGRGAGRNQQHFEYELRHPTQTR